MIISNLDFGLIIIISYFSGIGSGLAIFCKYKENIIIQNRDNLSTISDLPTYATHVPSAHCSLNPPVTKITLE